MLDRVEWGESVHWAAWGESVHRYCCQGNNILHADKGTAGMFDHCGQLLFKLHCESGKRVEFSNPHLKGLFLDGK